MLHRHVRRVAILLAGGVALCRADPDVRFRLAAVFRGLGLAWVGEMKSHGPALYILDSNNHRIVVVGDNGRQVNQIGSIGQRKGEFMFPSAFDIAPTGWLGVVDAENHRIQRFRPDGVADAIIPLDTMVDSIAMTRDGLIVLNTPSRHKLVSILDPSGKLLQSFGEPVPETEGYPGRTSRSTHLVVTNRAYVRITPEGDIALAYRFLPLVARYARDGRLLWRCRLAGPHVNELEAMYWKDPGARKPRAVRRTDGIQLPLVLTAFAVLSDNELAVALANGCLVILDGGGRQKKVLLPEPNAEQVLTGIAALGNQLYVSVPTAVYRLEAHAPNNPPPVAPSSGADGRRR